MIHRAVFFLLFLALFSCTKVVQEVDYPALSDGEYDSEFPYMDSSKELEKISRSIKKVTNTAYYKSYIFPRSDLYKKQDVPGMNLPEAAQDEVFYNQSNYGTATVIYFRNNHLALLTCAHAVSFPETILTYFQTEEKNSEKILQEVAIKVKQHSYINEIPEGGDFEILKMDEDRDIAVLGKEYFSDPLMDFSVFNYPLGHSNELGWGDFVYVMGFPIGNKMVTRGIVSKPAFGTRDEFIIDALFNRGFSGGIVLAVRDGVPNFELVGMAKSVSSSSEMIIVPSDDFLDTYNAPFVPYRDELYVQKESRINYGITYAVSAQSLRKFFEVHRQYFLKKGYDFDYFTGKSD